jgi:hypothetical protein
MIKSIITILFLAFLSKSSFSQELNFNVQKGNTLFHKVSPLSKNKINDLTGAKYLGLTIGAADIEGDWGANIGAFAELGFSRQYSFVLSTNYWKVKELSNFELGGLVRLYPQSANIKPYLDAGFGINFLSILSESRTKLGLILGGGIILENVAKEFNLMLDGKYKLIISNPNNLSGFIFSVGIRFPI